MRRENQNIITERRWAGCEIKIREHARVLHRRTLRVSPAVDECRRLTLTRASARVMTEKEFQLSQFI